MQRGAPVTARRGLPVPLFGLLGGRPGRLGRLTAGAADRSGDHDTVVGRGLPRRTPVQRPRQPVRGLPVPALGRGPHPPLRTGVAAMLQQIGERVGAQGVPLLGGLAQPVLGRGLVAAFTEVPPEGVRGRGGPGDGGDPPPSGGLVGVSALVQQDAEVVGGGAVTGRGGGPQVGFGSVEISAAQQHGPRTLIASTSPASAASLCRTSSATSSATPPASSRASSGPEGCTIRSASYRVAMSPITSIVAPPATRVHLVYRSQ